MKMRLRKRVGGDGRRRAGTEMLPRISDVSDRPGMLNYRVRVDDKETEAMNPRCQTTLDYHKCM